VPFWRGNGEEGKVLGHGGLSLEGLVSEAELIQFIRFIPYIGFIPCIKPKPLQDIN